MRGRAGRGQGNPEPSRRSSPRRRSRSGRSGWSCHLRHGHGPQMPTAKDTISKRSDCLAWLPQEALDTLVQQHRAHLGGNAPALPLPLPELLQEAEGNPETSSPSRTAGSTMLALALGESTCSALRLRGLGLQLKALEACRVFNAAKIIDRRRRGTLQFPADIQSLWKGKLLLGKLHPKRSPATYSPGIRTKGSKDPRAIPRCGFCELCNRLDSSRLFSRTLSSQSSLTVVGKPCSRCTKSTSAKAGLHTTIPRLFAKVLPRLRARPLARPSQDHALLPGSQSGSHPHAHIIHEASRGNSKERLKFGSSRHPHMLASLLGARAKA